MTSKDHGIPTRQLWFLRRPGVSDGMILVSGPHNVHGHRIAIEDRVLIDHSCCFEPQGPSTVAAPRRRSITCT